MWRGGPRPCPEQEAEGPPGVAVEAAAERELGGPAAVTSPRRGGCQVCVSCHPVPLGQWPAASLHRVTRPGPPFSPQRLCVQPQARRGSGSDPHCAGPVPSGPAAPGEVKTWRPSCCPASAPTGRRAGPRASATRAHALRDGRCRPGSGVWEQAALESWRPRPQRVGGPEGRRLPALPPQLSALPGGED